MIGGSGGGATLTFAADTVHAIRADLSGAAGVIDGGGASAYGYVSTRNIAALIGSAVGGDTLIGGRTLSLTAGSADALDTFDGGGGVIPATTVTLTGGANVGGVVTFAADTLAGAAGAVNVDLNLGQVSGGYGLERLVNIHHVIGSALGADTLAGDSANDTLEAGGGAAQLIAGTGANLLATGAGADTVDASRGTNTILAGSGALTLQVGTNADTLSYQAAATTVPGAAGVTVDLVNGRVSGLRTATITATAGGGVQGVIGSAYSDSLIGGSATHFMSGGSGGDDTFVAGGSAGTVVGSAGGANLLSFANDTAPGGGVRVDLSGNTVTGGFGNLSLSNIHRVLGSASGADTLIGDGAPDVLSAGGGAASLVAGTGGGTLNGGAGADTFDASRGASLIRVVGVAATILGGGTGDTLSFAGEQAGVTADAGRPPRCHSRLQRGGVPQRPATPRGIGRARP